MTRRQIGVALIALALVLGAGALGWRAWQNSDSQQNEREVDVLVDAMSGVARYEEPVPNHTGSLVLAGIGAVLFLSGIVLIAASPEPAKPQSVS